MQPTLRDHHPTSDVDVAVVGGRIAGASTAMLLARAGHRVAIVERAPAVADTLSTHVLFAAGNLQLRRWGLLEDVVASGAPPTTQLVATVDGLSLPVPFPDPATGLAALHHPRRTVLDPLVADAAVAAGVEVLDGVAVGGVVEEDRRVVGITGRERDGRPLELRARITVGADGLRSRIARSVGAPVYDEVGVLNATHYAYWSGLDDRGLEVWTSTAGLMAGVVPTNEGACVYVNCRPDLLPALRPDPVAGLHQLLDRVAPDLTERLRGAERTSAVRGTPGIPNFKRRPWGPGWALVGDAGCTKDPVSGHGISDAMVSAELAARAIHDVLCGADEEAAMRAFHAQRDAFVAETYATALEWASYAWTADEILEIQLRYGAALTSAAQAVNALPAWPGVPSARPGRSPRALQLPSKDRRTGSGIVVPMDQIDQPAAGEARGSAGEAARRMVAT